MPIDLIIFDCDGVLVDSEVISCTAHANALTRHGYPITAEQVSTRFLGRATKQANLEIETELGRKLPEAYHGDLQDELFRAFEVDLEAIRGIHDVLDVVTQRVCVASSGSHQRMQVSLGTTGLHKRLAPHIFSSSQVSNGKPAPDLFLFAAKQMGVPPERCVVIEDSLAGIAGARAAGMKVFGFCGGSHCGAGHAETLRQAGADLTFSDMHQLPELVRRLAADAVAG